MAKDYLGAIGGYSSLMSHHCTICRYRDSDMTTEAFFGAETQGDSIIGAKPKDTAFRLRIWQAFRKHFREVHPELIPQVNRSIKRSGLKI